MLEAASGNQAFWADLEEIPRVNLVHFDPLGLAKDLLSRLPSADRVQEFLTARARGDSRISQNERRQILDKYLASTYRAYGGFTKPPMHSDAKAEQSPKKPQTPLVTKTPNLRDTFSRKFSLDPIEWDFEPITLGPDEYFVIGDNRAASIFGKFPKHAILGKIVF